MFQRDRGRPIRIAMLTHGVHIGGGVPSVARWLSDSLAQTGNYEVHTFDLATSSRDPDSRRLSNPATWGRRTLQAQCEDQVCRAHYGANAVEFEFMRYRPRLELTRALHDYDLVQVVAGTPAWAATTRGVNIPVVLQAATTVAWERAAQVGRGRRLKRLWRTVMTHRTSTLESIGLRCSDVVMVENPTMLDHVRKLGHTNAEIAYPGIDVEKFTPTQGGLADPGYFLSVCRLADERKGFPRLIHSYAKLKKGMLSPPNLVIAGRGELQSENLDLIRKLQLHDNITIMSNISTDELVKVYQGAALFIQCSHEEGLGLTALEAMACGLPVIATETAGSRQTVAHGETGLLVPQGDDEAVSDAIARSVYSLSSQSRRSFGQRGRARVLEHFSTAATLRRFTETYSSLLAKQPARKLV